MQRTERIFIMVICLVGALLMYILFIFFDPGGNLSAKSSEPPTIIDNLDDLEEDQPDKTAFKFSRNNEQPNRVQGYTLSFFDGNSASFDSSENNKINEKRLLDKKPAAHIPLAIRQDHLRVTLIDQGYTNEKFIELMTLGSDDDSFLDAGVAADHYLEQGNMEQAIQAYEEVWKNTEINNHQIKVRAAEKIMQLSLMSGNLQMIEKYSNEYFKQLESILEIYKQTRIMKSALGREKVYQMEKSIQAGKSGSIINFLHAMKSGFINPRELIIGLKVAASTEDSDNYRMSNADIAAAEKTSEQIFNNYTR